VRAIGAAFTRVAARVHFVHVVATVASLARLAAAFFRRLAARVLSVRGTTLVSLASLAVACVAVYVGVRALTQQEYVILLSPRPESLVRGSVTVAGTTVRSFTDCAVSLTGPIQTSSAVIPNTWSEGDLPDGEYTLCLRVFGRPFLWRTLVQAVSFRFVLDNARPEITVASPQKGVIAKEGMRVAVMAQGGLLTGVLLDGVRALTGSPTSGIDMVLDTTELADGKHTICFAASDPAGNPTPKTVEFVVDNTEPIIRDLGIRPGSYVGATLRASPEVTEGNPLQYTWYVGDKPICDTMDLSWDTSTVKDGSYDLALEVTDAVGHTKKSEPLSVIVDNYAWSFEWPFPSGRTMRLSRSVPALVATWPELPSDPHEALVESETFPHTSYYLDGVPVSGPLIDLSRCSLETRHVLRAVLTDRAGKETDKSAAIIVGGSSADVASSLLLLAYTWSADRLKQGLTALQLFLDETYAWLAGVRIGLAFDVPNAGTPGFWKRLSATLPLRTEIYLMTTEALDFYFGFAVPLETDLLGGRFQRQVSSGGYVSLTPSLDVRTGYFGFFRSEEDSSADRDRGVETSVSLNLTWSASSSAPIMPILPRSSIGFAGSIGLRVSHITTFLDQSTDSTQKGQDAETVERHFRISVCVSYRFEFCPDGSGAAGAGQ